MLVKKKLNEINKAGTFKDGKNIKRTAYQNLENLQNLLIKWTVKTSAEKACLLYYEFLFSLSSGDKPNNAQKWKSYSVLYPLSTGNQFQANSRKNRWDILEAEK